MELLLRDTPAGAPREASLQRYRLRAEQQRQLICDLCADLFAVQDEQRSRLGEEQGRKAEMC